MFTFLIRCVKTPISDIVHNRSREQVCFLKDDSERLSQIRFLYFVYVNIIITNLSVRNIIKSVDKVGYGRLARARCADERNLSDPASAYTVTLCKNGLYPASYPNVDVRPCATSPLSGGICQCAVAVGVLPRPFSRMLRRFGDVAVLRPFLRLQE